MDTCNSDADFDSYWEDESRNKNRNRIRVGRQYQAIVPPLLKPGESDGRRCEDLETLKWKPDSNVSDQQLDQYLSMARAVSLFARAIDTYRVPEKASDRSLQTALRGLSDFVTSHHPCHHDAGCQVPSPSPSGEPSSKRNLANEWTPSEAHLFAKALEACGKNFGAIKKDFLPWKPVKSIIEYYYYGKGDKLENSAQCSEELSELGTKMVPAETSSQADIELENKTSNIEKSIAADSSASGEMEKFKCEQLETEPEDTKPVIEKHVASDVESVATVGSLKFYLDGRLVLKLNAQQENGPGKSKCHWVQSHDTPKLTPPVKKVKHKKKWTGQDRLLGFVADEHKMKKIEGKFSGGSGSDMYVMKKAKIKHDCASPSEPGTSFSLLCSSSWTPPVADGKDSMDVDDASSKASEDHQLSSPLHLNPRSLKSEIKCDVQSAGSASSGGTKFSELETGEIKYDPRLSDRIKLEPSCAHSSSQSRFSSKHDDSACTEQNYFKVDKVSSNSKFALRADVNCSQEVQCSKSAFLHCSPIPQVKGTELYGSLKRTANPLSQSPLNQQSRTQTGIQLRERLKVSQLSPECSCQRSSSPVLAFNSPSKELPLDLTVKSNNEVKQASDMSAQATSTTSSTDVNIKHDTSEKQNLKQESPRHEHLFNYSDMKSDSSVQNAKSSICYLPSAKDEALFVSSPYTKPLPSDDSLCHWNSAVSSKKGELKEANLEKECFQDKPSVESKKHSLHCSYSCCGVSCSLESPVFPSAPKCLDECSVKGDICTEQEKNDCEKVDCHKESPQRSLLRKECSSDQSVGSWFNTPIAPYLHFYPQCYPYYVAYSMPPHTSSDTSNTEIPLDLSSTSENVKNKSTVAASDDLAKTDAETTPQNSEAVERGMLYQLLKNKNSK